MNSSMTTAIHKGFGFYQEHGQHMINIKGE